VPPPGSRVSHPYFGAGRILSSSGSGEHLRVTVEFDAVGTKTLLWTHARLSPAEDGAQGGNPP
jgi:DNA helicase-2/ATP-dependent DNA helicase PcrA